MLFFLSAAVALRLFGAAFRAESHLFATRLVGWASVIGAAWLVVNVVDGWPPLWPIPVLWIIYNGIEWWAKRSSYKRLLWLLADVANVWLFGVLSSASINFLKLGAVALAFGITGLVFDWLSLRSSRLLRSGIVAVLVVIAVGVVILRPNMAVSGVKLVVDRAYAGTEGAIVTLNSTPVTRELSFTDITDLAGTSGPTDPGQTGGHGVMFADVDSNGRPDLYITMNWNDPMADLFYKNVDGQIFAADEESALVDFDGGSHGACFADLDNDGDYDLFNGTTLDEAGQPAVNDLFENDSTGNFSRVPDSGLELKLPTRGVLCFDFDSDGDLDLAGISNYQGSADPPNEFNELYRNEGNFQFSPISSGDLYTAPAGQGATDTDFDHDGDIDVITANRTGAINVLQNDGNGKFSAISPASIGLEDMAGDGISMGDVNNDGALDMLLVGDDNGSLYLNNGDGTFSRKNSFSEIDGYMGGFADLDNDGDLDLYFAGDSKVYLNDSTGNFTAGPPMPVSGLDDPRSVAFADIDFDGDLDLALGVKRSGNRLIRNNFNQGHWLKAQLISPQGQVGAFGAKISVYPAGSDTLLALREARSNNGYLAQNDPTLHIGLGSHTVVDIKVEFLDGTIVNRKNVPAHQTVVIDGRTPASLDRATLQWQPYTEWILTNTTVTGNPFDLVASVEFVHGESDQTHTTEMFYDEASSWRFRFTGTQPGKWSFTTNSETDSLNGIRGEIQVYPNSTMPGFVTNFGNKWAKTGVENVFIPQFVMYSSPSEYYNNSPKIDTDIQIFFNEHGFNGFHTLVFCRWFDITQERCSNISEKSPTPDPRTFEALELLIARVHAAGGVVHIWVWGDEQRSQTPKKWGINSDVDRRLQRYIAARLGPLPGWTMGYGFDLDEWVTSSQLASWRDYMHTHEGWYHFYGGRPVGPNAGLDHLPFSDWNAPLDYASYEHHRPSYEVYVAALKTNPAKPVFSEDRFRIRDEGRPKDYTMEDTRRGLWHSAMAGGVANIWGNVLNAPKANVGISASEVYPEPAQIKTYDLFFKGRFTADLERCNQLTDGFCLKQPTNKTYIFYREAASSVKLDLTDMAGIYPAVAVDTKLPYQEIDLGSLRPEVQIWAAPYESDWAIAIGDVN